MTLPKDASPKARSLHNAANKRSRSRLAERIENKKFINHDQTDPDYFNDIEQKLREILPEFEVESGPCETVCRWKGEDGNNFVLISETRPGALLKVWQSECIPVEF